MNKNMVCSPVLENLDVLVDLNKEKLVNMRVKGNRYYGYTTITDSTTGKRRQIEFALDVGIGELQHKSKAYIAYGKKLEQIGRGDAPNLAKQKFSKVASRWKKNPVCLKGKPHGTVDNLVVLEGKKERGAGGLVRHFGGFTAQEIIASPETVISYYRAREATGIKKSTLEKARKVLRWVMQSVSKTWEPPYYEFQNQAKEKPDEPLSVNQVFEMIAALEKVKYGEEYQDISRVMAFTGLDTSDVIGPKRPILKDGILTGYRGKTGKRYRIGVSREIQGIFLRRIGSPMFQIPSADAASRAISRAFDDIGLPEFHAKSLRDFYASILFNAGYEDNFIQDALGQVRGSTETKKYTLATATRLKKVGSLFDDLIENRRAFK